MASWLDRLIGRKEPTSAELAKERLKLVLVTDRSDLAPDKLAQMQAEIIEVLKRYLQVDEAQVQIKLEQRDRTSYLVADIPLSRKNTPYSAAESPPDSPAPDTPAASAAPPSE